MEYNKIFLIIIFLCSLSGFLIALLNNDLYKDDILKQKKILDSLKNNITNKNGNLTNNEENKNNGNKDDNKRAENEDKIEKEEKEEEEEEKEESQKDEKNNTGEEYKKEKKNGEKNKEEKEKNEEIIKTYNTVHIALNIDNKFIYPSLVFLTSLFENRKPTTIYDITILTCKNMLENYINKIISLKDKYGDKFIKILFINMRNDFEEALTGIYISTTAYYRIALPSLLPKIDRIIYTDVDVINFKDLTEMYNLELKENIYLRGILDQIGLLNELRSFGIYSPKYFNSGIILMNLKSMRKNDVENRIRNFIFSHYLDHHDQTAMNAVCHNNWEILSLKYAVICFSEYEELLSFYRNQDKRYMYNDVELRQGFYEPTLLHYAGWVKPWDKSYYTQNRKRGEYFWYYAKLSGYYDEIVKNYGFDKNYIDNLIKKIPEDGGLIKNNYKKQ